MLNAIKNFMRMRALKRDASHTPTAILPIREIHSAVAFIDVADTSFDNCKLALQAFFRDNNIKGEIFFFDFRKITSQDRLITSITNTVLRKDVSWYGKPSREKLNLLRGTGADMFISLVKSDDFPIEYMAKCSTAKFKVGRVQLPGNTFDMVISEPADKELSQLDVFSGIKDYLGYIAS